VGLVGHAGEDFFGVLFGSVGCFYFGGGKWVVFWGWEGRLMWKGSGGEGAY